MSPAGFRGGAFFFSEDLCLFFVISAHAAKYNGFKCRPPRQPHFRRSRCRFQGARLLPGEIEDQCQTREPYEGLWIKWTVLEFLRPHVLEDNINFPDSIFMNAL